MKVSDYNFQIFNLCLTNTAMLCGALAQSPQIFFVKNETKATFPRVADSLRTPGRAQGVLGL